jgi:hypothetical protein
MHDQSPAFCLIRKLRHSEATKFNSCPAKLARLGAAAGGTRPAKAGRKFAMMHANRTHSPPKLPNDYTVDRSAKQIAAFETIYFGLIGINSATRSERSLDQNPSQTGDAGAADAPIHTPLYATALRNPDGALRPSLDAFSAEIPQMPVPEGSPCAVRRARQGFEGSNQPTRSRRTAS